MKTITFFFRRGLLYSLASLVNRVIPEQVFRMRYFVVFRLDNEYNEMDAGVEASCRWCQDENQFKEAEKLSRFSRTRFENSVSASQALVYNMPVASCWVAEDFFDEKELGIRIVLDQHQRWIFGAMVDKQYRGLKIFPQLLRFTTHSIAQQNVRDQFAAVNPFNKASMAVFEKRSTAKVAKVFAWRLFGVSYCIGIGKCLIDQPVSFNCHKHPIEIRLSG